MKRTRAFLAGDPACATASLAKRWRNALSPISPEYVLLDWTSGKAFMNREQISARPWLEESSRVFTRRLQSSGCATGYLPSDRDRCLLSPLGGSSASSTSCVHARRAISWRRRVSILAGIAGLVQPWVTCLIHYRCFGLINALNAMHRVAVLRLRTVLPTDWNYLKCGDQFLGAGFRTAGRQTLRSHGRDPLWLRLPSRHFRPIKFLSAFSSSRSAVFA